MTQTLHENLGTETGRAQDAVFGWGNTWLAVGLVLFTFSKVQVLVKGEDNNIPKYCLTFRLRKKNLL